MLLNTTAPSASPFVTEPPFVTLHCGCGLTHSSLLGYEHFVGREASSFCLRCLNQRVGERMPLWKAEQDEVWSELFQGKNQALRKAASSSEQGSASEQMCPVWTTPGGCLGRRKAQEGGTGR